MQRRTSRLAWGRATPEVASARVDVRPIIGLVGQRGRVEAEEVALDRLVASRVVVERHLDLGRCLVADQPPFDRFLRRRRDPRVPLDHRLACQRIARGHILRIQPDRGAPAHRRARRRPRSPRSGRNAPARRTADSGRTQPAAPPR